MKKLLIIIILLFIGAVCIYYRQHEYYIIKKSQETESSRLQQQSEPMEMPTVQWFLQHNEPSGTSPLQFEPSETSPWLDYVVYDIDGDENEETLVITYDGNFIIYKSETEEGRNITKEIYREDFSEIKPWKVSACNLDNDGETDIFIGVYKDTIFYKDVRNRPFFYSWDGEHLQKKWLGSFFTDWDLVTIAFGDYFNLGYDVAAVLEKNNDNYRVGIYKFVGFGFENMSTSKIENILPVLEECYRVKINSFMNYQ